MKEAKTHFLLSHWFLSCLLAASVALAILFFKDGKTGSLLVQLSLIMGLFGSLFDLSGKVQRLENKILGRVIVWVWFTVSGGLVLVSLLFL